MSGVLEAGAPGRLKQVREGGSCGERYKANNSQQRDPPAGGVLPSGCGLWQLQPGAQPRAWLGQGDTALLQVSAVARALSGLRRQRGEGGPTRFRKRKGEERVSRKCSSWESRAAGRTGTSRSATAAFFPPDVAL